MEGKWRETGGKLEENRTSASSDGVPTNDPICHRQIDRGLDPDTVKREQKVAKKSSKKVAQYCRNRTAPDVQPIPSLRTKEISFFSRPALRFSICAFSRRLA